MPESDRDVLFVQGVQKTGSSTLVGILNCHPQVFVLYETNMARTAVSRYGNRILEHYPEARPFFRATRDPAAPLREFREFLETRNPDHRYRYFGDKLIDMDPGVTQQVHGHRVIFTLRDIRSWLCKEQIVANYRTDLDVVPATIGYLNYLIGSHRYPHAHRVWLEDLVEQNQQVIGGLSDYLDLDLKSCTDRWWEKIGSYEPADPKRIVRWYAVHPSSKLPPAGLDTTCELQPNPFWDEVLSIVQPYHRAHGDGFPAGQVARDLSRVEGLRRFSRLPLEDCYQQIETTRLGIASPAAVAAEPTDSQKKRLRRLTGWIRRRERV